jgi:hypothetical protein
MAYVGTPIDTRNTFQSLQGKRFNGDGSTTAFTLDVAPSSTLDIEVFVGNVRQDPNSAYTLSGTTLTFTGAPPSGTNNIYVVHQAKSVGTIDVPALGVSTASIQADAITEAKIADDAVESEHLNNNIISGQTALGATPADTDEFLVSDAGTIKRVDYSYIKATDNSPAFHAYANSSYIAIADDTYTTLACPNEAFDVGSAYNTSNYRFIPQTAGKYFVYANVVWDGNVNSQGAILLQKNQSFSNPNFFRNTNYATATSGVHVSGIIDMNGSSDYIEARVYQNSGGSVNLRNQGNENFFGGFLVTTST